MAILLEELDRLNMSGISKSAEPVLIVGLVTEDVFSAEIVTVGGFQAMQAGLLLHLVRGQIF